MTKARMFPTIGLPVVLAIAVAGFFAFWLWGAASAIGPSDGGSIRGVIEWTHRDATGTVLKGMVIKNTTVDLFKNDARARLGVAGTTEPATDADLYDNITLCGTNDNGGVCTTISAVANITESNPQSGTGAAGAAGVYSVAVTFTASGAVTVEELQLSKGAVVDGTAPTTSQIGAWQNVAVTLADGDTLTVTWTVTVS